MDSDRPKAEALKGNRLRLRLMREAAVLSSSVLGFFSLSFVRTLHR